MQTIAYKINFKKFRKVCSERSIPLPKWFTHLTFDAVLNLMKTGNKLQACKYLCDHSSENKTRGHAFNTEYTGYAFDLKWSKNCVADVIDEFKIEPAAPINTKVSLDTTKDVMRPFVELTAQLNNYSHPSSNHVVFAFNGALITMGDLNALTNVFNELKRSDERF
jgi:hypothetical protein